MLGSMPRDEPDSQPANFRLEVGTKCVGVDAKVVNPEVVRLSSMVPSALPSVLARRDQGGTGEGCGSGPHCAPRGLPSRSVRQNTALPKVRVKVANVLTPDLRFRRSGGDMGLRGVNHSVQFKPLTWCPRPHSTSLFMIRSRMVRAVRRNIKHHRSYRAYAGRSPLRRRCRRRRTIPRRARPDVAILWHFPAKEVGRARKPSRT